MTQYRTLQTFGTPAGGSLASLIECRLQTGRTHQIRVHMASIGYPLVGDQTYGRRPRSGGAEPATARLADFPRQALHAHLIGFQHPHSHESFRFQSDLPPDFMQLLDFLERL